MVTAFTIESESTLTDRYQTTIPEAVRSALGLRKRDKIHYSVTGNGEVVLSRADSGDQDPVLGRFLDIIARDMGDHPDRIQPLDSALIDHVQTLTADIDVDLDAPLANEDE